MSVGKRGKLAVLLALILLLTTLFLYACSSGGGNVRLSEIITSVEGTPKPSGESGKESASTGDATSQTTQTDADATVPNDGKTSTDNAVATDQTVAQDDAASGQPTQSTDTQTQNDQTQNATDVDGDQSLQTGEEDQNQSGTNVGENTYISDQNEQNDTLDETSDQNGSAPEETLHEGYYRITARDAGGVWTLVAGSTEIGTATISEDGVLYTSDLTQTVVELWGADDAYGNIVPYLYFDVLGMKEVYFRDELMTVQIDLTEGDLAVLLPEKEQETDPEQGETPSQNNADDKNGDEGQQGDGEQNDQSDPQDGDKTENQQNGGEQQTSDEQNNGGEQNVEDQQDQDEQQGGESENPVLTCAFCGADLLAGGHLADCVHYAVLPEESAAYTLLSALTGVWEDCAVTAMAEDVEIYSLVLNYMDEAGVAALSEALLASDVVLMDALSNGVRYLSVQKDFEEKPFMIEAQIQRNGEYYKADLSLSFALD